MAGQPRNERRRSRRPPAPLDAARLEEMALAYVARFATSAGRLAAYCRRKLRERGHAGADEGTAPPDIDALVARFVASGFVDDAGYARAKAGGLLRRGYGSRRVGEALRADGIGEQLRADVAPGEHARREAVVVYARRRRFGPFARAPSDDPRAADKQLAAMLRAGHGHGDARHVLRALTAEALAAWVDEACEDTAR